ncbi:hypothetical protein M422DRAFT_779259 [Sphaerobolus stellatus SS14]|uniref:Uncharacterized protein n=1 Tax=Sphaerobolus stellatus (strain SS14) TaxID=990650 RepID=A0A0C9W1F2_SPHS4|nr:hypothetical protein M422DRAFT_779259 [Sphaerobolus stellatus SS14]
MCPRCIHAIHTASQRCTSVLNRRIILRRCQTRRRPKAPRSPRCRLPRSNPTAAGSRPASNPPTIRPSSTKPSSSYTGPALFDIRPISGMSVSFVVRHCCSSRRIRLSGHRRIKSMLRLLHRPRHQRRSHQHQAQTTGVSEVAQVAQAATTTQRTITITTKPTPCTYLHY